MFTNIDWKILLQTAVNRLVPLILASGATYFATKWAAGAQVMADLYAGKNVSLWNGVVNLSLDNIRFWIFTGGVALVSFIQGWLKNVRAKRAVNIALQLPKGATLDHVKQVAAASSVLSTSIDPIALKQVSTEIG